MTCVLTLALDAASQERFESLRQQWFPPERNQIPAHVSLFHTLPEEPETETQLARIAAASAACAVRVSSIRSIGRGVAYFMESPETAALHRRLSAAFAACLTPQDRQGFRPHVVVQNKAEPAAVALALATLQASFAPWDCTAVGMDLWRYLGGPWHYLRHFSFAGRS